MHGDELRLEDCVPGVVVFGRVKAFPWWPAIIGRTSEGTSNEWKDAKGRRWVFFFGDDQGAWLPISKMKIYSDFNQETLLKVNDRNEKYDKFREKIQGAVVLANHFLSHHVPPTENLFEYNVRITPGAIEPLPLPTHLSGKGDNGNGDLTETSDEEFTDTEAGEAGMDLDDGQLPSDDASMHRSEDGKVPNGLPAETAEKEKQGRGFVVEGGDPGKTSRHSSLIEKASLSPSSSSKIMTGGQTNTAAAAMDTEDAVDQDNAPPTNVQSLETPVEYGRSKRKRVKSTKLNDFFVVSIKKTRKRKSKRTPSARIMTRRAPKNPEDIVTQAISSSSSSDTTQSLSVSPSNAEKIIMLRSLIPLRLALKKTACKYVSIENAPPRKRITWTMTAGIHRGRVEDSAASSGHGRALDTDADSVKKFPGSAYGTSKVTEPWKSDAHDGKDVDMEGNTARQNEVLNSLPRLEVTKDRSGENSLKVLVPKQGLEEATAASGQIKRNPGRPKKGSRSRLVSNEANLKGSRPTHHAPLRRVRQLSEQAVASASTPAPMIAESKKMTNSRGNKKNSNAPAEPPRVKRKYRKRGTGTNKDGTFVNGKGLKRSSERENNADSNNYEGNAKVLGIDGFAAGGISNTLNVLNGAVVPETAKPRGSQKSTIRNMLPISAIAVAGDISTENEDEDVVAQRLSAMNNSAPAAQQEKLNAMMNRIVNLEAHIHRLNKKHATPKDEMSELLRISGPTKSIARLKVSTDLLYMAMRDVVDDTDYNPVKMAEVIQEMWPREEVNKNEPDRIEKEGIRSIVRGLLWDRQVRGARVHKKRMERREKQVRKLNKGVGSNNGNNSSQMAVADAVLVATEGSTPNSSGRSAIN